jgi:hypothetical protein
MKQTALIFLLCLILSTTGCITVSGEQLAPLEVDVAAPADAPSIQETVGNFSFHLDGGKMITSNKAGRIVNEKILEIWKKRGYIEDSEYVKSSEFTGRADYNLTLSGSLYGESSIFMQFLSGLTLLIIPHSIEQKFDIQYTLEDVRTKKKYGASVEESYTQWSEFFLIFAFPWSRNGAQAAFEAMADHIYDQLRSEGAFENQVATQ